MRNTLIDNDFTSLVKTSKRSRLRGLSTGKACIDSAINMIQPGQSIAVAASNKVGKSKWTREHFVLGPYISEFLDNPEPRRLKGFYYSLESSKEEVMADCTAYICNKLYGTTFGKEIILGRQVDPEGNKVVLSDDDEFIVETCIQTHIIPLFGAYKDGKKIVDGLWDIITEPNNPTGVYKELITFAESIGTIEHEEYYTKNSAGGKVRKKRISGFKYTEPMMVMVIIDDVRLLSNEKGYSDKQNIDKWCEYTISLCEKFKFTVVNIVHTNREEGKLDSLKYYGENYYPNEDQTKDSGNIGERMKIVFTLMNPIKYNLKISFSHKVSQYKGNLRIVNLVLSRDTESPQHFPCVFNGKFSTFNYL